MRILVPVAEDNIILDEATGAAISEYASWSGSTAYVVGDTVSRSSVDGRRWHDYEATAVNTNLDPRVNFESVSPSWIQLGLSNRYKAFDRIVGSPAVASGGSISYRFEMTTNVTSIAIFSMIGQQVTVSVQGRNGDGSFTTIAGSNRVLNIADSPNIGDWFQYFFSEFEITPDALFDGLPAYVGNFLWVEVASSDYVEIGEIVFGKEMEIGTTLEKPTLGIRDYSRKERDEFGRPIIVERPYSLYGEFDIAYPSARTRSFLTELAKIRAVPAVYYVPTMDTGAGTMIFGYFTDFSMNLNIGEESYSTITVEGLV